MNDRNLKFAALVRIGAQRSSWPGVRAATASTLPQVRKQHLATGDEATQFTLIVW